MGLLYPEGWVTPERLLIFPAVPRGFQASLQKGRRILITREVISSTLFLRI